MTGEAELRRTSDAFLTRIERLHELENRKRSLTPGTQEMIELAQEIERLSSEVLGWAQRETDLARLAGKRQPTNIRPISEVPPRTVQEILADWRDAERALEAETAGTPGWEAVRVDVESLRDEYRRALERRRTEPDS